MMVIAQMVMMIVLRVLLMVVLLPVVVISLTFEVAVGILEIMLMMLIQVEIGMITLEFVIMMIVRDCRGIGIAVTLATCIVLSMAMMMMITW